MIDVPGEYDGSVEEVRLDMLNTTSATLGVRESSVSYFRGNLHDPIPKGFKLFTLDPMTLDQAMTALSILVERNSKNISYKFYLRPTIEGKIEIYKKGTYTEAYTERRKRAINRIIMPEDPKISFSRDLLPSRKLLKNIVEDLLIGSSGKEIKGGMAFVVLAEQFMSTAQKEIYKKLSQYQRKFYIEYLADEYIAEFCEEFGIAGDVYESVGLPELEFFDPYKRSIISKPSSTSISPPHSYPHSFH